MTSYWCAAALVVTVGFGSACARHRMTDAECQAVLLKLTELELAERGFHDPELARRRAADLAQRFRELMKACPGQPARADVMSCVREAPSTEYLAHDCLR